MKNIIDILLESQKQIASMKPTHCGEISFKMRKGVSDFVETIDSHYTIDGVVAVIKDKRDGQEYILEIKPKK